MRTDGSDAVPGRETLSYRVMLGVTASLTLVPTIWERRNGQEDTAVYVDQSGRDA